MIGLKHLVQCRCVLQQYKKMQNPPLHKFVVFSIIDDTETVISKFVACNNCGVIHKVFDITKSIIVNREEASILDENEIKCCLPQKLISILDTNNVDRATLELIKFNFENKMWGSRIVLSSELIDGEKNGKILLLLGENLFKIEQFITQEVVK